MRGRLFGTLAAGAAGAVLFAAPLVAGPNDHKNKYPNDAEHIRECGDGDTVTYTGPNYLWPPNHKMQAFTIVAHEEPPGTPDEGNPDAAPTALTVTPAVTDATGGDGNADPDWEGELVATGDPDAVVSGAVRAERSGQGEGRTYTLDWTAEFDDGAKVCSSTAGDGAPFTITVPHDQRGGAGWKHDTDGDGQGDNGKHGED